MMRDASFIFYPTPLTKNKVESDTTDSTLFFSSDLILEVILLYVRERSD